MKFAFGILTLLCASLVFGSTDTGRLNVVRFSAEARAQVPNDEVEIVLSVEKQGQRPSELAEQINRDMQWALSTARSYQRVQAQTRDYRTEPRYDRSGTVIGWQAAQSLHLSGTDIEEATRLATALQERLLIKSMQFKPSDATRETIEDSLAVEALKRFRERAELIREAMAMNAYDVIEIQLGNRAPPPIPVYRARMEMAMEAMTAVATEPGTSDIVVSVEGAIQLR